MHYLESKHTICMERRHYTDYSHLNLLHNRLLIRRIDYKQVLETKSGLEIVMDAESFETGLDSSSGSYEAEVVRVGEPLVNKDGTTTKTDVQVGDRLVLSPRTGLPILDINTGEVFFVINPHDIIARRNAKFK